MITQADYQLFETQYRSKITELESFIEKNNSTEIEQWFKQENLSSLQLECLHQFLKNRSYESFIFLPDHIDMMKDLEEFKELVKNRYFSVYRFFPLTEQLHTFINMGPELEWENDMQYIFNHDEHFSLDNPILDQRLLATCLIRAFYNEQFLLFDKLEALTGINFLTQPFKEVEFRCSEGGMYFGNPDGKYLNHQNEPTMFHVYQNVMIHSSENTRQYLAQKGIALPNHVEAKHFEMDLRNNHVIQSALEANVLLSVKSYHTKLYFAHMNQMINEAHPSDEADIKSSHPKI